MVGWIVRIVAAFRTPVKVIGPEAQGRVAYFIVGPFQLPGDLVVAVVDPERKVAADARADRAAEDPGVLAVAALEEAGRSVRLDIPAGKGEAAIGREQGIEQAQAVVEVDVAVGDDADVAGTGELVDPGEKIRVIRTLRDSANPNPWRFNRRYSLPF